MPQTAAVAKSVNAGLLGWKGLIVRHPVTPMGALKGRRPRGWYPGSSPGRCIVVNGTTSRVAELAFVATRHRQRRDHGNNIRKQDGEDCERH